MPFWMNFYRGYGIHELPYWPNGYREGEDHLGMPVSHGCVRLGIGNAEKLFNWAEIGIPVYIDLSNQVYFNKYLYCKWIIKPVKSLKIRAILP